MRLSGEAAEPLERGGVAPGAAVVHFMALIRAHAVAHTFFASCCDVQLQTGATSIGFKCVVDTALVRNHVLRCTCACLNDDMHRYHVEDVARTEYSYVALSVASFTRRQLDEL